MQKKVNVVIMLVIVLALALSACAPAATPTAAPTAVPAQPTAAPTAVPAAPTAAPVEPASTEIDPASVTGDVISAGSSTVYPLAERMVNRFTDEGFTGRITVDSIGSGAGFERFCTTGETDIANASRAIKSSEVEACAKLNRTPIEFRVGTDALAVVVSSENTFLTGITLEELAKVFSGEFKKWSDVNPAYPAEDIQRFSPGTDSGTFDYFVEGVMRPVYGKDNAADKNAILNAPGIQFSEDDNVLVQGVEGSPYAIGYFGYAYFAENQGKLKALSLNGIAPSLQTAEDNTYPLSRPLYLYSDAGILKAKPQVAAFISFFLTYVNEEIQDVGYFPASDEALDASRQALMDALK